MITLSRNLSAGLTVLVMLTLLTLAGCGDQPITASSVRSDLSPELDTVARSSEQRKNDNARAMNLDGRQIGDDWDNFWMVDRPAKLSQYTIP